jgi:RNA polymerase sigma-70 factor, ECF subfamily
MKNPTRTLWLNKIMTEPIDWDSVFQSELPRIYNFFLYRLGERDLAQDLTATTFERAWKLRAKYRKGIASLPTWFFGIARNVLLEHFRNDRSRRKRAGEILLGEEVKSNVDVEKNYQQNLEKGYLQKLIFELPEREQDLIALKYGAGLTNREIAKLTRFSESNVGSILHRTIKSLRNKLEDYNGR